MATKKSNQSAKTETSTFHIETKKGHPKPNVRVIVESEELFKNKVGGFFGFLREKAVVGLAVGFVIATQVQAFVKQLITGFIDPAFKLWFGGEALSKRTFTMHFHGRHQNFGWGSVIYALLDFLFVILMIYVIIKLFNLDKLDQVKDKK